MTQAGTRSATPSAVPRFTRLEAVDPADVARDRGIDPMAYLPDMDVTDSPVLDELLARAAAFDFDAATEADVRAALAAASDESTVITNVMTGRLARGVANRVMREVGPIAPEAPAFPHAAT
ncbi:MAG: hypothetical protein E6958_14390, partial [Eggerthella sp.]|nr:hypothetical protein [Eggerthella sp.]